VRSKDEWSSLERGGGKRGKEPSRGRVIRGYSLSELEKRKLKNREDPPRGKKVQEL